MARFNFNTIDLTSAADITKIMENFTELENNGISNTEANTLVNNAKTALQSNIDAINTNLSGNYTKTTDLKPLAKVNYSYGTDAPSGGSAGDVYDQYFN